MNTALNLCPRLALALDRCVDQVLAQTWLLDLLAAGAAWPSPGDAEPPPTAHAFRARRFRRKVASHSTTASVPTPRRQEKLPC